MKIINCQSLGEMCEAALDGEPVFLVRAQDKLSTRIVEEYIQLTIAEGGRNVGRAKAMLERMVNWQLKNPNKIKVPD